MSIPQRTYTNVNGQPVLTSEVWVLDGQYHRLDGPAWQQWDIINGQPVLIREGWHLDGQIHRPDGPAWQEWEIVNGQSVLTDEEWYFDGQRHRLSGPAWLAWEVDNGQVFLVREEWYVRGIKIGPEKLRMPVRRIEQWWPPQRARRQQGVEQSLLEGGMTVWPGFMGLLKEY